jgi:thiamine-phosphate pyrophosphorylase
VTWLDAIRVVAITDRRLMVPAALLAGGDWPAIAAAFGAAIARMLDGTPPGAIAIQVREKDLDGGPLLALARAAIACGAPVLVNDRLDVALAAGAAGVHLPERGLALADARAIAPGLVIGCSRHAIDGLRVAADLVHLGPIWPTPGKSDPLGPDVLAAATSAHLVAVGGIDTPERAQSARAAGADAIAVIRAAWTGSIAAFV